MTLIKNNFNGYRAAKSDCYVPSGCVAIVTSDNETGVDRGMFSFDYEPMPGVNRIKWRSCLTELIVNGYVEGPS